MSIYLSIRACFTVFFILIAMPGCWAFQGFGKNNGGNGKPLYHVTTLADSGQGSLRDALSQSNRHVVFDIDGEIKLNSPISVVDLENITLDAATNKSELKNLVIIGQGIYFSNSQNVIIQNLRIRQAAKYGILLTNGSNNIIIDHCSIENSSTKDVEFGKNIDINNGAHDITVSYSIIGYFSRTIDVLAVKYKGMLITDNNMSPVTNVSLHHNLFYQNYQRSPQISTPGLFVLINNIVFDWRAYGTRLRNGAEGDLIGNYYQTKFPSKTKDALILTDNSGLFYLEDNIGVNPTDLNPNKLADSPVGSWPKIRIDPADQLLSWLPFNVGAQPHDCMDAAIADSVH